MIEDTLRPFMLRLGDDQWERIREHFPEEHLPESRPGRRPVPARAILEAVLWILNTGAQWHLLPQCYPNYKTVHRRFRQWCERQVLREILTDLANALRDEGALDERESFIDATFAAAFRHFGETTPQTMQHTFREDEGSIKKFSQGQ